MTTSRLTDYLFGLFLGLNLLLQVDGSLGDVFAYDDTDQVTGVQYDATNPDTTPSSPARTVSYGFDPVGNRTNVTDNGSGTSYTANNLNQYTAVGAASPTYDPNGNLTNYNGWGYAYDAQNRLWGAANSNTTGLFTYDARNRVVSRVVNGTTNYYFYDDWNLVSDRDAAGNPLQTYVHGPRIDELIFKTDGSNVVYYHHDALGNVTHLTDSYSRVVERYRYDIYGQASIKDGNGNPLSGTAYGNRFQFTGREYLAAFGLHDYRNRVYLQSWGRFIQTDPIRFDAKDINIYRYCVNNSLNKTDAMGLNSGGEVSVSSVIGASLLGFGIGAGNKMLVNYMTGAPVCEGILSAGSLHAVTEAASEFGSVGYWANIACSIYAGGPLLESIVRDLDLLPSIFPDPNPDVDPWRYWCDELRQDRPVGAGNPSPGLVNDAVNAENAADRYSLEDITGRNQAGHDYIEGESP